MATRRNIFLWVLYDFANSIVSVVFFLYFAQWVVIDQGVSDFRFNLTFTASAVLLLLTAPLCGSLLDTRWRRITGLRITTVCTTLFYTLCAISALQGLAGPALIFFTLGLYSYLLSFTFYTPLLIALGPPQRRGRISGFGIAANYLGQFAGLALALPFANGTLHILGGSPRAETLLPSVALFVLFALPMLFFFSEPARMQSAVRFKETLTATIRSSVRLFANRGAAFFLISFFLFNDAILTAINNFPIFLEQVWRLPDSTKTYLLMGILVTTVLGGLLTGFVADAWGHRRVLRVILSGWLFLLPLTGLITGFPLFVVATVLMGFWYGATWTVSRSVMSYVSPEGLHNLAFAYYGVFERASSLIGPLFWGAIVSGLVSLESMRYRIAMIAISLFIIAALAAFKRVPDERVAAEIL